MATKQESILHEHVVFNDERRGMAVGAVPFTKALYVPRTGERLYLPGTKQGGSVLYEVESVVYCYSEEEGPPEGNAKKLTMVDVRVKRVKRPRRV